MEPLKTDYCGIDVKTRLICAIIILATCLVCSLLAFISFNKGNYTLYAVIYTISTVGSIAGSFFLFEFERQIASLKHLEHMIISIIMVVLIMLAYIFAFATKIFGLTIATVVLQFVAVILYYLSLSPGGLSGSKALISPLC